MKTVRIVDGIVVEIIPEAATIPNVAHWYGESFANQCVTAPDEVEQRWVYDQITGTFSAPEEVEPAPRVPTEMELAQQDITDLQLSDIEQGQQMTDLELTILGGGTNV